MLDAGCVSVGIGYWVLGLWKIIPLLVKCNLYEVIK